MPCASLPRAVSWPATTVHLIIRTHFQWSAMPCGNISGLAGASLGLHSRLFNGSTIAFIPSIIFWRSLNWDGACCLLRGSGEAGLPCETTSSSVRPICSSPRAVICAARRLEFTSVVFCVGARGRRRAYVAPYLSGLCPETGMYGLWPRRKSRWHSSR
jgi:hypothetical protein